MIIAANILNRYEAPKISTFKHSFLDVECRDDYGVRFVVKIQVQYVEGIEKRIQYDADKTRIGRTSSSVFVPKPNQLIAVSVLDFVRFQEFSHYFSCHEYHETVANEHAGDTIKHYFIELPLFSKTETELETSIEKWCYFLKHVGNVTRIPEKLNQVPYRNAFEILNRTNMTKEEWEECDASGIKMQDERGMVIAAYKKGLQEAMQLHKLEMARKMQEKGIDQRLIAKVTGILLSEIEKAA